MLVPIESEARTIKFFGEGGDKAKLHSKKKQWGHEETFWTLQ